MSYSLSNPRFCHECRLVKSECICHLLQKIDFSLKVWIWQDQKEKKRKNNTGFWLTKLLEQVEFSDENDEFPSTWVTQILENPSSFALLFPHEGSLAVDSTWDHSIKNLIVLDTTWDKARSIVQKTPVLTQIQAFHLENLSGQFTIRKAPFDGAVSTIESVAHFFQTSQLDSNLNNKVDTLISHRLKSWESHLKNSNQ